MINGLSEKELQELLEKRYSCRYMGRPISPPYRAADDMPAYYKTPSGITFSVQPPLGTHYAPALVDAILTAAKLNVVIPMTKKSTDPEK